MKQTEKRERAAQSDAENAPDALRQVKFFASLDDGQLQALRGYLETVRYPQFSHIVREGDHGDAMYVVLEGEVRALSIVAGKESILSTMARGECFGEISLLDQGPRSADVIANKDSVLLRLSAEAFARVVEESPGLAVPFLLTLSRALVERLRRSTKKYEDTIRFIRGSDSAAKK